MVSTILAVAAGLLGMVMPAQAGSLAAFYTPPLSGAQVIYQNSTTGDITHSLCTSIGEPIFPMDSPKAFQLPYTAKNGTSLTATGWWDGSTVWAVIIYQSVNNDIVQATYKCDQKTGTYTTVDSFLINGVKNSPTIHPNTGLSINLLGAAAGEHLYFHDTKKAVHAFYFTTDSGWTYGSKVSPDNNLSGMGLTSSFFGANETVFVPKDNKNVEMAVWNTDATWHISTFPQPLKEAYDNKDNNTNPALGTAASNAITLPAWDGTTNSLASSIDKDNTKYLFYIGTDKKLHLVTSALNSGQPQPFIVRTEKGPEFWPVADKANADLGIAFNPASYDVTLFYFSNGGIVAVNQTGKIDAWNTAYTLPQVNTTVEDTGSSGGLSTGAKAGLGVGVSVGVILIVAALAFFYVRRQRQKRLAQEPSENPEMAMGPDGQMIHPGHLSAQMTGQPPYDYTQVQQYDYNQQNYGQQWAADNKKAFSPDPTYGQMQHSMGVEMPDSSPAPHRLSELPANYNSLSHELPAADVDRIQAASPEPQSAYTPAISQPSEYGTAAEPGSPHQRAPSAVSWTAVSPPPTYVSQSTSPAPSAAYGQSQYMQPISPQVTGDYQFQQQPQQAYVQQGQAQVTQSPQMQRESLGAISEQHESTNVHYQHQQQQQQYEQYQQQPQQQQQYEQYQQQPQQQQYEQYQQQQQYEQYQQQQQQQQQQPQQQQQHPQQHPQQHQ